MKSCVLCLPLTIPSEIKPGLILTPFTVSVMSRLTGLASVCCVNLTGLRYTDISNKNVFKRFKELKTQLKRLGSSVDHYWTDNSLEYIASLQRYCDSLVASGDLQCHLSKILICDCGAVEIIKEAISSDWSTDRKVIYQSGGKIFCRRCNTQLKEAREHVLLLRTEFSGNPIVVTPSFYQKEVDTLQEGFSQPILVSRRKKNGRQVLLFGRAWQLDTDFCWSLLLCSLVEDKYDPRVVVVSSRSLKPLVWTFGVSHKVYRYLGPIMAIVTPYVQFKRYQQCALSKLIDRYGQVPIRLLLASGLRWNKKDTLVDSNIIFWTIKALEKNSKYVTHASKIVSAFEACALSDGHSTDCLISDLRKLDQVVLSPYQNILLEGVLMNEKENSNIE